MIHVMMLNAMVFCMSVIFCVFLLRSKLLPVGASNSLQVRHLRYCHPWHALPTKTLRCVTLEMEHNTNYHSIGTRDCTSLQVGTHPFLPPLSLAAATNKITATFIRSIEYTLIPLIFFRHVRKSSWVRSEQPRGASEERLDCRSQTVN